MPLDALALTALHQEIAPQLAGSRIQKVVVPSEHELALETYAPAYGRRYLVISVHPDRGHIRLAHEMPARTSAHDTPFTLLARKHLRGALIRSLHQPYLERVWEMELAHKDDAGHEYLVQLIVEVMGRRSNLLLVDEHGTILDAVRRTPPSRNPTRPVLPHLPYQSPPAQEHADPLQVGPADLAAAARGRALGLEAFLVSTVAGLSPTAAREVVFRALGASTLPLQETPWDALVLALHTFVQPVRTAAWSPCVALENDVMLDYAPYLLHHLEARGALLQPCASINEAVERAANAPRPVRDPLRVERQRLTSLLQERRASLAHRAHALQHEETPEAERLLLRRVGDTLLARQDDLRGHTELLLEGQQFPLDPRLSPVENAQQYFSRYRKQRDASTRVPELLQETHLQEEYLAQLATLVETARSMEDLRALRGEVLAAAGVPEQTQHKRVTKRPGAPRPGGYRRVTIASDWELLVGTSAQGNATVTFKLAEPNDLWLHARGVPGAHVVLRAAHRPTPVASVLQQAAQLAAWHSARRQDHLVEVDVVAVREVRKVPHAPAGLVRYGGEQTIRAQPQDVA